MKVGIHRAAQLLGTSEQMLLRWARQGVIPAVETRGEFTFEQKDLENWAAQRNMTIHTTHHPALQSSTTQPIRLKNALACGDVIFNIDGGDVKSTLTCAVDAMTLPAEIARAELLAQLLEREQLASTGIGNGVAIPHPRHPFENVPHTGIVTTVYLKSPVDYNAIDSQPVFVLFILLSPDTKCHLQLLSKLSYCLHNEAFLNLLHDNAAKSPLLEKIGTIEP